MGWIDTNAVVNEIRLARDSVKARVRVAEERILDKLGLVDDSVMELLDAVGGLAELQRDVRRLRLSLLRIGRIGIHIFEEDDMARLRFAIALPPLPEDPGMQNEIARGQLTVQVGVEAPLVIDTDKTASQISDERFVGEQGQEVTASFVWVDDAGNQSVNASTAAAVLADTIPPADPGALGIQVVEEIPDEVPPAAA